MLVNKFSKSCCKGKSIFSRGIRKKHVFRKVPIGTYKNRSQVWPDMSFQEVRTRSPLDQIISCSTWLISAHHEASTLMYNTLGKWLQSVFIYVLRPLFCLLFSYSYFISHTWIECYCSISHRFCKLHYRYCTVYIKKKIIISKLISLSLSLFLSLSLSLFYPYTLIFFFSISKT